MGDANLSSYIGQNVSLDVMLQGFDMLLHTQFNIHRL